MGAVVRRRRRVLRPVRRGRTSQHEHRPRPSRRSASAARRAASASPRTWPCARIPWSTQRRRTRRTAAPRLERGARPRKWMKTTSRRRGRAASDRNRAASRPSTGGVRRRRELAAAPRRIMTTRSAPAAAPGARATSATSAGTARRPTRRRLSGAARPRRRGGARRRAPRRRRVGITRRWSAAGVLLFWRGDGVQFVRHRRVYGVRDSSYAIDAPRPSRRGDGVGAWCRRRGVWSSSYAFDAPRHSP